VEVVDIAIGSCFSNLTQNLGLQDVSAKHISQLLTVEQKEN
jgi:tRNA A37 threonylcarbamoyltransferase TsaD